MAIARAASELGGCPVGDDRRPRLNDLAERPPEDRLRPGVVVLKPRTSRSGRRVSSTAKDSRTNSGFQATTMRSPAGAIPWTSPATRGAVPTDVVVRSAQKRRSPPLAWK